jgi:archaellum biogenesis protein FlaJ (TadC family)
MILDIKKFTQAFNRIARHKSQETVFTDFLDMLICALSAGRYEEEYLAIVQRYKRDEIDMFCELMAEMLIVMDNHGVYSFLSLSTSIWAIHKN